MGVNATYTNYTLVSRLGKVELIIHFIPNRFDTDAQ